MKAKVTFISIDFGLDGFLNFVGKDCIFDPNIDECRQKYYKFLIPQIDLLFKGVTIRLFEGKKKHEYPIIESQVKLVEDNDDDYTYSLSSITKLDDFNSLVYVQILEVLVASRSFLTILGIVKPIIDRLPTKEILLNALKLFRGRVGQPLWVTVSELCGNNSPTEAIRICLELKINPYALKYEKEKQNEQKA